jgi:hypothetical protein
MKPKPTPKRELIIVTVTAGRAGGGLIQLRCASEDAKEWVRLETKVFGDLFDNKDLWMLAVNAEYDANEVAAYLDSYNDDLGEG